jgi:hypothetical protein
MLLIIDPIVRPIIQNGGKPMSLLVIHEEEFPLQNLSMKKNPVDDPARIRFLNRHLLKRGHEGDPERVRFLKSLKLICKTAHDKT